MPRTGGVFSLLSGSKGSPNTPIQSAPYNSQLDDFAQDANLARPITAGGTGATTASGARTNLGLGTSSTVNTGTSGATIPLLNGANTWSAAQTFSTSATFSLGATLGSGISFGSNLGASATDLSKHVALWGSTFGFNVTSNSLNYVSSSAHNFYAGATLIATLSNVGNLNLLGSLNVTSGGTGATDAATARANLGLGNVTNTSDANKPVSTAQQTALNLKANLTGATFTGEVVVPPSVTGGAGFNIPHGATPTTLANGDIWTTTAGFFYRINGVTRQSYDATTMPTVTQAIAEAGTDTTVRAWTSERVAQAAIAATGKPTYGTLITASTAAININSGIPSDAKRITLVSNLTSASAMLALVQLGTGGVLKTSGYVGGAASITSGTANAAFSTSFILSGNGNGSEHQGTITLTRLDPTLDTWILMSMLSYNGTGGSIAAGSVTLSGALNRIQIGSAAGSVSFNGTLGIIIERF